MPKLNRFWSLFFAAALLPGLRAEAQQKSSSSSAKNQKQTSSKAATSKKSSSSTKAKASASPKRPVRRRTAAPQSQLRPTQERYAEVQEALANAGYFSGPANGDWGESSLKALQDFQSDQGLEPTGKIDALTLIRLGLGPNYDNPMQAVESDAPPPG